MSTLIEKIEKGMVISIILSIITYFIMFLLSDFNKIKEALGSVPITTIVIMLLLSLINYIIRFLRWHLLLRNAKIKIDVKDSMKAFFAGLSLTITPGKAGELFKASFVKKFTGVSRLKVIPITIIERVFDLTGFATILLLSILFSSFKGYNQISLYLGFGVIVGTFFIFFMLKNKKIIRLIEKSILKIKQLRSKEEVIKETMKDYSKMSFVFITMLILVSFVSWSFEVLALKIILNSLNQNMSLAEAGFVFGFSSLAGLLIFTPGGIGGFEGTSYSLLTMLFLIPASTATAATLIIRLTTLWFSVLIGIFTYIRYIK